MSQQEEYILTWEAPKIEPPEFRLYYDEKGNVICYTCEKLEGNYVIIDAQTFAEGRPDLRVIEGKISTVNPAFIVSKLMPDSEGIDCSSEDISIVVSDKSIKKQKWKLHTYELR
jgi:hypothetical protein